VRAEVFHELFSILHTILHRQNGYKLQATILQCI